MHYLVLIDPPVDPNLQKPLITCTPQLLMAGDSPLAFVLLNATMALFQFLLCLQKNEYRMKRIVCKVAKEQRIFECIIIFRSKLWSSYPVTMMIY